MPFLSDEFQNKLKRIIYEASKDVNVPFRIVNKNSNTLRNNLSKLSQKGTCTKRLCHVNNLKICLSKCVVYHAKCSVCNSRADYVGSSRQLLHDRAYQHYTRTEEAIHQHNHQHGYTGLSFDYTILAKCASLKEMLFSKAIFIKRLKPTLNQRHELEDVIRFLD